MSTFSDVSGATLKVKAIPAFADNYLWLIHNDTHAVVVDPGDATPILSTLNENELILSAILLTHHHPDHVGGVPDLLSHFQLPVYGPPDEKIAGISNPLSEGDHLTIPELRLEFSVLRVPGHTRGHLAYVAADQDWLFCGDTLFGGGCGRLFEGTAEQMITSLEKLAALPNRTEVFCAHEYTLTNLRFAYEVEPQNKAIADRLTSERLKLEQGKPTIPSTIALEKATNPFLRFREDSIVNHLLRTGRLSEPDPVAAFAALRQWKNSYR